MVNVYVPEDSNAKARLWEDFIVFMNSHICKYLFSGDFNKVRVEDDWFGSVFSATDAVSFNQFITDAGVTISHIGTTW